GRSSPRCIQPRRRWPARRVRVLTVAHPDTREPTVRASGDHDTSSTTRFFFQLGCVREATQLPLPDRGSYPLPCVPTKGNSMTRSDDVPAPTNGELVSAADMPDALTTATLVFDDGATQTFTPDG